MDVRLVSHPQQPMGEVDQSGVLSAKRKSYATVHKNDSWDAECMALVLSDDLHHLPDFKPDEHYWVMRQLTTRRRGLIKSWAAALRQMHVQPSYMYPSYHRFFSQVDGKTALAFFINGVVLLFF